MLTQKVMSYAYWQIIFIQKNIQAIIKATKCKPPPTPCLLSPKFNSRMSDFADLWKYKRFVTDAGIKYMQVAEYSMLKECYNNAI